MFVKLEVFTAFDVNVDSVEPFVVSTRKFPFEIGRKQSCTEIAVPTAGAPDEKVIVTVFEPVLWVIAVSVVIGDWVLNTNGRLSVKATFSHFVICVPYSKSVSISA